MTMTMMRRRRMRRRRMTWLAEYGNGRQEAMAAEGANSQPSQKWHKHL